LAEHVACMDETRNVYRTVVVKAERKKPFERPRSR